MLTGQMIILFAGKLKSNCFSEKAICISGIKRIINSFIDTDIMRSLSYSAIIKWLLQIDALCGESNPQGKMLNVLRKL